jgi:hypothetical protein
MRTRERWENYTWLYQLEAANQVGAGGKILLTVIKRASSEKQ